MSKFYVKKLYVQGTLQFKLKVNVKNSDLMCSMSVHYITQKH
jgi:hypothetical protein